MNYPLADNNTINCGQMVCHLLDQTHDNGAAIMSLVESYINHFGRRYYNFDFDERQDILQEVAIKLLCHGEKIRDNCSKSWVYTVVRNQCLNHIRDHSSRSAVTYSLQDEQATAYIAGSLPLLNESTAHTLIDELDCLEKVFARIESQQTGQADISLYTQYAFGLSYAEISERSQRTVDAVGQRISVLKKRIKSFMDECC